MAIQITLSKSAVYKHVLTLVAIYARGKENYEAFSLTPDNYPLLDELVPAAVSEVRKTLAISYTNSGSINNDNISLTLNDDSNLIEADTLSLLRDQISFGLSYMLAALWLSSIETEAGESYAASATSYMNDAAALFARRFSHLSGNDYGKQREDDTRYDDNDASMSDAEQRQQDTRYDDTETTMTEAVQRQQDTYISDDNDAMAGAMQHGTDCMLDGQGNTMDDSMRAVEDNVIEKPWAHRHCLRDCRGHLIITKSS